MSKISKFLLYFEFWRELCLRLAKIGEKSLIKLHYCYWLFFKLHKNVQKCAVVQENCTKISRGVSESKANFSLRTVCTNISEWKMGLKSYKGTLDIQDAAFLVHWLVSNLRTTIPKLGILSPFPAASIGLKSWVVESRINFERFICCRLLAIIYQSF